MLIVTGLKSSISVNNLNLGAMLCMALKYNKIRIAE